MLAPVPPTSFVVAWKLTTYVAGAAATAGVGMTVTAVTAVPKTSPLVDASDGATWLKDSGRPRSGGDRDQVGTGS